MRLTILNPVWDADLASPEDALARFHTLTGWADAAAGAGAEVTVVQRFHTALELDVRGCWYRFVADGGAPKPTLWQPARASLCASIAATQPDVVHVNGVLTPRILSRLRATLSAEVAVVVQDHGGLAPGAVPWLQRRAIRRGLDGIDALLVASPGQIEEWRRTDLAPAGLPIADVMESSTGLRPIPRDQARLQTGMRGAPAMLWVGRLNANKDPLTVLAGVAAFAARRPDVTLTMVFSEADLEAEVRRVVAETPELAGRVRLVGRVAQVDLASYYSAADLFVLGSRHEGSGYAVIEALACGAAPVVTDIGPFRALTADGTVGAIWSPGNPAALALALERAAAQPAGEMRASARALFETSFSWPAIGRRAASIYDAALARTRR